MSEYLRGMMTGVQLCGIALIVIGPTPTPLAYAGAAMFLAPELVKLAVVIFKT